MSNVNGSISVNVEFRDSTTLASVERLKTIALRDTTEYTTGKVAVLSRTAGTTSIVFDNIEYRNASGAFVSFDDVRRVAFSWSGAANDARTLVDGASILLRSRNGEVSCTSTDGAWQGFEIQSLPGGSTGTYTIVMYGT
jgi:hypothetical protein